MIHNERLDVPSYMWLYVIIVSLFLWHSSKSLRIFNSTNIRTLAIAWHKSTNTSKHSIDKLGFDFKRCIDTICYKILVVSLGSLMGELLSSNIATFFYCRKIQVVIVQKWLYMNHGSHRSPCPIWVFFGTCITVLAYKFINKFFSR